MRYNPTMPNKRFIPYLVALLGVPCFLLAQEPLGRPANGVAPAQAQVNSSSEAAVASKILDEAIAKIRNRPSVAADISLQADMLNEKFRVVGQYLKAPEYRVLLRLSVEGLADARATTQQICDGSTIFNISSAYDEQRISSIKLAPLLKALSNPDADPEFREGILAGFGFSGPEALLQGLRKVAAFDLGMKEDDYEGHPVYILRGQWNDRESLGLPTSGPNAQGARIGFLPPYVPSQVAIWVGRDNGWPYKLVMEGKVPSLLKEEPILDPTGRPIAKKPTAIRERPSRLTLVYSLLDRQVSNDEFQFQAPPSAQVEDLTERVSVAIEAQIADLAARRRSQGEAPTETIDPLRAPRPESAPSLPAPSSGAVPAPETPKASSSQAP